MKPYENKQALLDAIHEKYSKYIAEFENIPETLKDKRSPEVDRTPSENLSYQLGWVNLLQQWDADEREGKKVQTPTPEYKWNNLGGLYESYYQKYGKYSLHTQIDMLNKSIEQLDQWILSLSDQELFEPNQRQWATSKAQWPVWRWIHINTVAPFTNFRTKIRKWKKLNL